MHAIFVASLMEHATFVALTYKSDCYQVLLLARYTIQGPNMFTTTTDPKNKYKKFSFKYLEP